MTFDEGCAFKALWRNAAARMGNGKPGNTAIYDAEKMVHYTNRILAKEKTVATPVPSTKSTPGWFAVSDSTVHIVADQKVEVIDVCNAKTILPMQDVKWSRIKMYRYVP